jgi:hypothetical protein
MRERRCRKCGKDISDRWKSARFCTDCADLSLQKPGRPECGDPSCSRPALARGWCRSHYLAERKKAGGFPKLTLEGRFWSKVVKNGPVPGRKPELGPCWVWQGRPKREGYGQFSVSGEQVYAHRFSYELLVKPIPDGLQIDHLCRNRICVNPEHLEPVPSRINTLRGDNPRLTSERGRAKTHCKHGHPFNEANTYWYKGRRHCKACADVRQKAGLERLKAERHARGLKKPPSPRTPGESCLRGHPLSGDNLYIAPSGFRECRTCRRISREARKAAKRAA